MYHYYIGHNSLFKDPNILYTIQTTHGTVDNNLGPDCLAGPKVLDPNHRRQPTL